MRGCLSVARYRVCRENSFSLRSLSALCVSAVNLPAKKLTAETQRTRRVLFPTDSYTGSWFISRFLPSTEVLGYFHSSAPRTRDF
jgi:hypothetical protein